jgi:cell division protein FtsN
MARRGEDGFHFTLGQLALLAGGVCASVGFAFFLGIYVGREAASQHAPLDERVAKVPAPEPTVSKATRPSAPAKPETAAVPPPATATVAPSLVPPVRKGELEPPPGAVVPYTVQVVSTRDRSEAETVRSRLLGRRIGAFLSEVEEGGGRWYRVRIGRYDDVTAANAMADRVKKELGYSAARVVPASTDAGTR